MTNLTQVVQEASQSSISLPMLSATVAVGLAVYFFAPNAWAWIKSLIPKRVIPTPPVETPRDKQQRALDHIQDAADICDNLTDRQKFAEPLRKIAGGVVYPPSVTVRKRGNVQ